MPADTLYIHVQLATSKVNKGHREKVYWLRFDKFLSHIKQSRVFYNTIGCHTDFFDKFLTYVHCDSEMLLTQTSPNEYHKIGHGSKTMLN